ncbi:thiamine pyrophosphate-binding protein [Streptomyces fulvoviolaceus]|uniref:thiamine pyrophosphate-binding protein n=1 Tax=Streptomyces fulvoviolaceus TaxID=285535 RepID=UPI0021C04EF1|nr:thiamine pyrophosphate-binding protein [Streptomyces fulvoviolaceus]MCT9082085.1 thiamine pyrophosphate-binding protein [Streptomyces fulvoviolaceus]
MTSETTASCPKGAELLVDTLVSHGVDTVFGVPGDTGVILYDALAHRVDAVRHVLARDQRHAGYMADGYARTRRRLGVCEVSSGGGAVCLASGLGEAYAAAVPVLAITSDIHRRSRGTGALTEIDQEALFGAVTKWCRTAERAADIPALVTEAVTTATGGRPGPVALILPEDVLEEHAPGDAAGGGPAYPAHHPRAAEYAVTSTAADLAGADRPVILAGGGVHASGAWPQLRALAEHAALPVATTLHGKAALPEDHPLSLGVAGANGSRGYADDHLAAADAVLIVGSRANATDTDGYTCPTRDAGVKIAQIDTDAARAGRDFPRSVPLVGDAAIVLDQLRARLPAASAAARTAREEAIAAARNAWAATAAPAELHDGLLPPREVVLLLHRLLGPRAWVVADPGTPTPHLAAYWESAGEARSVVIPRGHGPMGYAIPAAIGVAVAHPGERVLCMTTEGSLAMGVGDWETAARLALPITFVVLDNTSMGWIKMLQRLHLEQRCFGVDPGPVDAVLLATGMGIPGARATTLDQLELLVEGSMDHDGPAVIHVPVPEQKDASPPVAPWPAALAGRTTTRPVH